MLSAAWALPEATAFAQEIRWSDVVVEVAPAVESADPSALGATADWSDGVAPHDAVLEAQSAGSLDPEALRPLARSEIEAINALAAASSATVRAIFQNDPHVVPQTTVLHGMATLVQPTEGDPVLLTASLLVAGAESVEVQTPSGWVEVGAAEIAIGDAYGLAVLSPARGTRDLAEPLPIGEVARGSADEVFSTNPGTSARLAGPGGDGFGFYQLDSTGAILGAPVINRRGELVGIGSHRYPLNQAFTLSVPSHAIREYLSDDGVIPGPREDGR